MTLTRSFLAIAVCFSLSLTAFLALPIQSVEAQDSKIALQRGWRTGYSDGYMAGYRDTIDSQTKSYARHSEYDKADRAYNKDYGTVEDYRDGYKQGFEAGYDTGFEKLSFEATVPANISRRGNLTATTAEAAPAQATETAPAIETPAQTTETAIPAAIETTPATQPPVESDVVQQATFQPVSDAVIIIPRDTELIVELLDPMGTEQSREGDKFLARVISPQEITGAIVEGRVSKIMKPGRIKRRSEILLSFDRLLLNDKRWSNFNATLTEVMPVKGDNVKKVDDEGSAVGKHSYKEDALKVGAATGTGAGVGAIAGGPVGAAVGAGVGAAFGVGAVVIERGKHIKLNKSQQLRIKTGYEVQIR